MMALADEAIDRLYQIPLDEFTAARNALAKDAGTRGPEIKRLEKPNLAAWAVNQLYWRERKIYDELIESAEGLRTEQRKQLSGKSANVAIAESRYQGVLQKAKQVARGFLAGGSTASDPVLTAIAETLDALPGSEPPGRLTKPIRRVGFGALTGVAIASPPKKPRPQEAAKKDPSDAEERERAMLKERLRFAESAEREADAALERARRALERAEGVVERITGELDEATNAARSLKKKVSDAEAARAKATKERERLAKGLGL